MLRSTVIRDSAVAVFLATGLGTGTALATPCTTTGVSLTIAGTVYLSSSCGDDVAQGGGALAETSALNNAFGTSFVYLDSTDSGSGAGLGGIAFSVTADSAAGTWAINWTDLVGLPSLPIVMDFAVGLFGGNNGAGYLFQNVLFPASPTSGSGTFAIEFLNSAGTATPLLGHLLLAGGNVSASPRAQVPEPASLGLLGVGLAALGMNRWRRRRKA